MSDSDLSIRYFIRIVKVLAEHQQIGISNLVALTRMHHSRCSALLEWMEKQGYLTITDNEGCTRRIVVVTEKGMEYIKKLLSLPLPVA